MLSKLGKITLVFDCTIILCLLFILFRGLKIKLIHQEGQNYFNLLVLIVLSYGGLLGTNYFQRENKEYYKCRIIWRVILFLLINILGIIVKWSLISTIIYLLCGLTIILDILENFRVFCESKKIKKIKELNEQLDDGEGINLKEIS